MRISRRLPSNQEKGKEIFIPELKTIVAGSPQKSQTDRLTLGLLTHSILDEYGVVLWHGVLDAAKEHDVNLISFVSVDFPTSDGFAAHARVVYDLVSPARIDGLVMSTGPMSHTVGLKGLEILFDRYHPLPLLLIGTGPENLHQVVVDNAKGLRELFRHLIEAHGYRRIAFIKGPDGNPDAENRYRIYTETLANYDIPLDLDLVTSGNFTYACGRAAISLWLEQRHLEIDAIVAANDLMAFGVLEALQHRGVRVPTDIAVAGFDDVEEAMLVIPSLTTVRQPVYEMGHRATDMLISLLRGEAVPQQVTLSTQVIIRQSCGCQSPIIVQAAAETIPSFDESLETAITARRTRILTDMQQSLKTHDSREAQWMEQLLDAFAAEILKEEAGSFLAALQEVLIQVVAVERDTAIWQNPLSVLRQHTLPVIRNTDKLVQVENLWQQARIMVGEITRRVEKYQRLKAEYRAETLRRIEGKLVNNFDLPGFMNTLISELPELNIHGLYLSLYENPERPTEWSQLLLASNEQSRMTLQPGEYRFPSRQLVPERMLPQKRSYSMVLIPLHFQSTEEQIGYVLFEVGPRDGITYDALRVSIGSALQGALLMRKIQENAAALAREKYIVDAFMAGIPDCIFFKDRRSRITRANMAYAKMMGYHHPQDIVGKSDFDFFPKKDAQIHYEQEQGIIGTGVPIMNVEEYIDRPDGRVDWLLTTKMPLCDEHGEIIGTFGISKDITELKQAQEGLVRAYAEVEKRVDERTVELNRLNKALQEEINKHLETANSLEKSEKQYRLLAQNVRDGIIIIQTGKLAFANPAFAIMLGYSPDDLVLTDPVMLFHKNAQPIVQERLDQMEADFRESRWQAEMVNREGQTLWAEIEQTIIEWDCRPALLLTIRNITDRMLHQMRLEEERKRLRQENMTLKSTITERYRFGELVGKSTAMQKVYGLILNIASTDVNVLISGESGTGKELIARTIQQVSPRKENAFVPVNCASLPETLFEREFFGHRKGTFTGADRDKPGLFDRAHRGTLFLDEVTELPPSAQAKLLRVLQDGEYTPLGSHTPKKADVLILAATNKDCQQEIKQGRLRRDFFYRICVIEIDVPPLRDRKDDLPLLIESILEQYRQKQAQVHGKTCPKLSTDPTRLPGELVQALYAYDWPGNVRELQNILQRYLATKDLGAVISLIAAPDKSQTIAMPGGSFAAGKTFSEAVETFEKQLLSDMLARHNYHTASVSEKLGLTQRTLQRKIKQYHLREGDRS